MKECPKCQSCYEDILAECPIDNSPLKIGLPGPTTLAGRFRIEACLGKGGMGTVYRAMHLGLKRYVALKTLQTRNRPQGEFIERFRREAEAAGRIKNPHVVDVMDFGFVEVEKRQVGYLIMEFLEGRSLKSLINEKGKLSLEDTVNIMNQICQAVEVAHSFGVIHRDLKPDNIWLEDDPKGKYWVKVLDFGLAKLAYREQPQNSSDINNNSLTTYEITEVDKETEADNLLAKQQDLDQNSNSFTPLTNDNVILQTKDEHEGDTELFLSTIEHLTQTKGIIGTIPYMSPEQCDAKPCTPASDIYSLGVIAYEMIAGRLPFIGKGFEIAIQHIFEDPLAPSHFNPELPKVVDEAILRALNKDPKDRPASAKEFAVSFGAYLAEQKRKRASVNRIVFGAAIIVSVLGISAMVNNWFWFENNWQAVKVAFGWAEQNKSYRSYSKLKLVWPASGKELVLATSNPVKASMLTIQQFIAKFSSDGSLVAVYRQPVQTSFNQQPNLRNQGNQSQKVELWNTLENKKIHEINLENFDTICDLRFSQDSKLLAISGLNEVRIIDIANNSQLYSLTTLENNDFVRFLSSKENLLLVASVRRPQVKVGVSITYPIEKQSSIVSLWHLNKMDKNQKPTEIVNQYGKIEFIETIPFENGFLGLIQWHISKKEPSRRIELWRLTNKASLENQWDVTGDGGMAITKDGSKIALHLSPSRIVELHPLSGEEIKEYSYSINPRLKTIYLFYNKDNNLVIATPERLENLTQGKLLYTPPSNSFFVDFTPSTETLLIESVTTEVND